MRFADDFVGSFQLLVDAQNFQQQLRERFARFNLELAEDKTRLPQPSPHFLSQAICNRRCKF